MLRSRSSSRAGQQQPDTGSSPGLPVHDSPRRRRQRVSHGTGSSGTASTHAAAQAEPERRTTGFAALARLASAPSISRASAHAASSPAAASAASPAGDTDAMPPPFEQLGRTLSAPLLAPHAQLSVSASPPLHPFETVREQSAAVPSSSSRPPGAALSDSSDVNSAASPRWRPAPPLPPQPLAAASTPRSTPAGSGSLQAHMWRHGLLEGHLSDLRVVAGERTYRLHRVVLAQADYFATVLAGGYADERASTLHMPLERPMSRAAFECCVAHLYGGTPELALPPWALHTNSPVLANLQHLVLGKGKAPALSSRSPSQKVDATHEATNAFWHELSTPSARVDMAVPHHPATPAFLLSLVHTAAYLQMTDLTARALHLLMSSISPWTVSTYLRFALGQGLGPSSPRLAFECARGIRSLEGASTLEDHSYSTPDSPTLDCHSVAFHAPDLCAEPGPFFTTSEGATVGEACACYLSKYGADFLRAEEWLEERRESEPTFELDGVLPGLSPPRDAVDHVRLDPTLRAPSLAMWSIAPSSHAAASLPASWVRALISSDAFFIGREVVQHQTQLTAGVERGPGPDAEFDRYVFARRVVELRRRARSRRARARSAAPGAPAAPSVSSIYESVTDSASVSESGGAEKESLFDSRASFSATRHPGSVDDLVGEDELEQRAVEHEESEFARLFSEGIYYSHFNRQQLFYVAHDRSPTTGQPYVPLSVLQNAMWLAEEFKELVPRHASSIELHRHRPPASRPPAERLGLTVTASPGDHEVDNTDCELRRYFAVPQDDTSRLNAGFAMPPSSGLAHVEGSQARARDSHHHRGSQDFCGLLDNPLYGTRGPDVLVAGGLPEEIAAEVTAFEPCRFSAEFWGVHELGDKQRLYSETFFYGGSQFNCYLQKATKKNAQLGIYLHRQSPTELFPAPSHPPPRGLEPAWSPSLDPFDAVKASRAPFVDGRKQIQAYFSITCPSPLGTSMTRFSSGPDSFAISQSWGFRSQALASLLNSPSLEDSASAAVPSLRVNIILGLV